MRKLIAACIIFLCLWKEYCEYEPTTNNNGDEVRRDIREIPRNVRETFKVSRTSKVQIYQIVDTLEHKEVGQR
jgi:hypothetical protein